ncbi:MULTISPECIES: hypothetical protein [unclassified Rathayibacter]|uniref:hypothetical protein n=1 Tax=unclassified Rathayibacter TaxID=2609250 RepID=UPI0011B0B009|nr:MULTISPECIES: hypothetical protein [unclassified Rathayibacter]
MDDLDDLVRRAAPPALGEDPAAADAARGIARAVAERRPPRRSWFRSGVGATVLAIGLVGVGTTAAVAGPSLLQWVGWTPDVAVQRAFELTEGADIGTCAVVARIQPEYGGGLSDEETDELTERAREFLAQHDWDPVIARVTPEAIEAALASNQAGIDEANAAAEAAGRPADIPDATPGVIASSLMGDEIRDVLEEAGYFTTSTSIEMAGQCDSDSPGTTE